MQFVCLLSFHFLTSSSFLHSAHCTCCRRRCIAPHTSSSHWLPLLASLRAACATWRCNTVHACVLFMCIVWHPVSILYWAILCFMAPQCTQSPLSSARSIVLQAGQQPPAESAAPAPAPAAAPTDSRLLTIQSKLTNNPTERQLATAKDAQPLQRDHYIVSIYTVEAIH